MHALLSVTCQMCVCIILIIELIKETLESTTAAQCEYHDILVILVRFACAITLHIKMLPEYHAGLNNVKLVLNHRYRFDKPN